MKANKLNKKLNDIKRRCKNATEGPWWSEMSNSLCCKTDKEGCSNEQITEFALGQQGFNDVEFTAYARQDIPMLLEMVEFLRLYKGPTSIMNYRLSEIADKYE